MNPAQLLVSRRFLPLFVTQFLGAFNDNLFRSALIMLITYRLAEQVAMNPAVLNNLAIGLFILPYFMLSALAGQLADKYEKRGQIVWIKIWEILLTVAGAIGFYFEILPLLMAVLAGLGVQSTFFGPIKYAILPDLTKRANLLAANAVIEAGTFIAILLGTIVGGLVVLSEGGVASIAGLTIGVAVVGTATGYVVPKTGQAAPDLRVRKNIFMSTRALLAQAWGSPVFRPTIIGISWIWTLGSIYLTQIPVLVKDILHGDETVVTLILAAYTVGIGAGSFLANRLLGGVISARLSVPGLWGLTVTGLSLFAFLSLVPPITDPHVPFYGIGAFLSSGMNWVILGILMVTSVLGGLVIVPLYTILQDKSERGKRSQTIASNNIFNSLYMFLGAVIAAGLLSIGFTTAELFIFVGLANLISLASIRKLDARL